MINKIRYDYTVTCSADTAKQHSAMQQHLVILGYPVGGKCDFHQLMEKILLVYWW